MPSIRSACMTVSTLSAMISRETREKCIPSCPIAMPSLTEIVPNSSGYPPPACTPSLAALASRSSERLQGVISFQELATPIWGLAKSSSVIPTARSMPRAPPLVRVRPGDVHRDHPGAGPGDHDGRRLGTGVGLAVHGVRRHQDEVARP